MKNFNILSLIFTLLILGFSFTSVKAQDDTPDDVKSSSVRRIQRRPNLLQELNLSREQIQQIRSINQSRKPLMQESQIRLREANRALDEAIYADTPDETLIQERLKAVQLAQAEHIKNRTQIEFAIRRVLNPDQLVRFRELRRQLMNLVETRKNRQVKPDSVNTPNPQNFNRQRRRRGF